MTDVSNQKLVINIDEMARTYVKNSNKLTYFIIFLFVDRHLVYECFKAYAYFRWLDDIIDDFMKSKDKVKKLLLRQDRLIHQMCDRQRPNLTSYKEVMLQTLISNDNRNDSLLRSYIVNFFNIIEFDSKRRKKTITGKELRWYSQTVGKAVTDCMLHFIGNNLKYSNSEKRYLAAEAAHIAHMLRDYVEDIQNGYFNIPKELIDENVRPNEIYSIEFQNWIKERIKLARTFFKKGKEYIYDLEYLKIKIATLWYCLRFEKILDTIEKNDFKLLNRSYKDQKIILIVKMLWVAFQTSISHFLSKGSSMNAK